MAEQKNAVDVLNSHHTKLNQHTTQIAKNVETVTDLQVRIDALDKRVAAVEADHRPMRDFMQRINDWVAALKD